MINNKSLALLIAFLLFSSFYVFSKVYNPQCNDGYYILTPPISKAPRLNGAYIIGVRPNAPFLYKLPVTGKEPVNVRIKNLPEGLSYDKSTRIISGVISNSKYNKYTLTISLSNSVSKVKQDLDIVVGNDIALTPPMGWSSWIANKKTVTQHSIIKAANDLTTAELDKLGYSYVNIDDAWQGEARGGKYHAIMPNTTTFPDIKGMVDTIHAMGLKAGIYSTPWESSYAQFIGGSSANKDGKWDKSLVFDKKQRNLEGTCSRICKYKFAQNDAKQWADWGFDYMKYDWNPNDSASIVEMAEALHNCGRDIVFSISNSCPISLAKVAGRYVQVIRTNGDLRARWNGNGEHINMYDNWEHNNKWLKDGFCGAPGHTPDPDFLMVGLQKYGSKDSLTADELYHHVSSYVMWGAPLLLSCDISKLTDFEKSLLTNVEMIDIDQDRLSKPGRRVFDKNGIQVLVKELSNGDKAIGIFNFNDQETIFSLDLKLTQLTRNIKLRDVWRQKEIGTFTRNFDVNVRPHGVIVLRASSAKM